MIIEYHRPETIQDALRLLARSQPHTVPLGGGTVVNQASPAPLAVVDLQALGLDTWQIQGNTLWAGAMVRLQTLLEADLVAPDLKRAIDLEASYNLRQMATLAGTVMSAGGRSPLVTALLALDVQVQLRSLDVTDETRAIGDLLPLRGEVLRGVLVTRLAIPLNARLVYQAISRTPADLPIVCVAISRWPSGRTRVALGGFGSAPVLAMDGPESDGAELAARSAFAQAGDEWASAEYRSEMAALLTGRGLAQVQAIAA